jgi:hypothetical protein
VIRGASDGDAMVATCDRPAELLDCGLSPLMALVVDDNCSGIADKTRLCVGIAAEFTDRELLHPSSRSPRDKEKEYPYV